MRVQPALGLSAGAAGESPPRRGASRRALLQALSRDRAAAHDLDQLARKRDRLACLQDVVVEREAPKSSVHVLADDLRRLGDSRRHRHGASFRSETVKQLLGVLFVFRQHEGETDREQDIGRISIHRFAVLFENLLLSLQVLEVASEPVADIAVLCEKPESPPFAATPYQHLRPAWLNGTQAA